MTDGAPEPAAVFLFYEDGSGVDAYPSLTAARNQVEAIDVENGEYAFFTVDGRRIEATVGGRGRQDVWLEVVAGDVMAELRERLATALVVVNLDPALAADPIAAAQALLDGQWESRWPRRPAWLDRRLHGSRPVVRR
jgi:hypothetical protein